MENISIRKLSIEDDIPYGLLLEADPSIDSVNEYICRGDCYLAYYEDRVIGVYILINTRPHTIEIINISVDKRYQGRGIGKLLIYNAINVAKEYKAKVLEVGTGNSSISQLAFYQKCGFRIVGVEKDFFTKYYEEKIVENGIECRDMIRLNLDLDNL